VTRKRPPQLRQVTTGRFDPDTVALAYNGCCFDPKNPSTRQARQFDRFRRDQGRYPFADSVSAGAIFRNEQAVDRLFDDAISAISQLTLCDQFVQLLSEFLGPHDQWLSVDGTSEQFEK